MRHLINLILLLVVVSHSEAQIIRLCLNGTLSEKRQGELPNLEFSNRFPLTSEYEISLSNYEKGHFGLILLNNSNHQFISNLGNFKNLEALTIENYVTDPVLLENLVMQLKKLDKLSALKIVRLNSISYRLFQKLLNESTSIHSFELISENDSFDIGQFPQFSNKKNTTLQNLSIQSDSSFILSDRIKNFENIERVFLQSQSYKPLQISSKLSHIKTLKKFLLMHNSVENYEVVYENFPIDVSTKSQFLFYFSEWGIYFRKVPNGAGRFIYTKFGYYNDFTPLYIDCRNRRKLNLGFLKDTASSNLVLYKINTYFDLTKLNKYKYIKSLNLYEINTDSQTRRRIIDDVIDLKYLEVLHLTIITLNPDVGLLSKLNYLERYIIDFTMSKEKFDLKTFKDMFPLAKIITNELPNDRSKISVSIYKMYTNVSP